jgi:hypothetical protein
MFGEMPIRIQTVLSFLSLISHVVLLALFCGSAVFPTPVPMADSFAIFVRSWSS